MANVLPHLASLKSFTMSSLIWNPNEWMGNFTNILPPGLPRGFKQVVFYAVDVSPPILSAMWTDFIVCQQGMIAQRPSEVCLTMTMPEIDALCKGHIQMCHAYHLSPVLSCGRRCRQSRHYRSGLHNHQKSFAGWKFGLVWSMCSSPRISIWEGFGLNGRTLHQG